MSTPNFKTMDNFPLYAWDLSLLDGNYEDDEAIIIADTVYEDTKEALKEAFEGKNLLFHEIEVISGRYGGLQIYVDDYNKGYNTPCENDNEACHEIWGMCRSKAIRAYKSEINKINKVLKKVVEKTGFVEIACTGVFSNGEAVYSIV